MHAVVPFLLGIFEDVAVAELINDEGVGRQEDELACDLLAVVVGTGGGYTHP